MNADITAIKRTTESGLQVANVLHDLVTNEILPGTGVDATQFWSGLARTIDELAGRNRSLLARRDHLQKTIDKWHQANPKARFPSADYQSFLTEIGYLVKEGDDFEIDPTRLDPEITIVA